MGWPFLLQRGPEKLKYVHPCICEASAFGLHLGFSLKDVKDGLDVVFLALVLISAIFHLGSLMVMMMNVRNTAGASLMCKL